MKRSVWLSIGFTGLLTLWVLSGLLWPHQEAQSTLETEAPRSLQPMQVEVTELRTQPVTREVVIQGQIEPQRGIQLRAQTQGQVAAVTAREGGAVKQGTRLVHLRMDDRQARLAKAEAQLQRRQAEYAAGKRLKQQALTSETQLKALAAQLAEAQADLEQIRLDIRHTQIKAPIDGYLNRLAVERGDWVSPGAVIAELVDDRTLVVSGQVPQQLVAQLTLGQAASVRRLQGEPLQGELRYIARQADAATRSFRIEVEVDNPAGQRLAGMSGEIRLPVATVSGHFISPAMLALDDEGRLGVKAVNAEQRVEFHAVELIRATAEGAWVSGLPDGVRAISLGQGFVRAGDRVTPVTADAQS